MSLFAELQRRKVFRVAGAYLVVGWLLIQVAATVLPQFDVPASAPRLVTLLVALGFPVALVAAWALESTLDGVKLDRAGVGSKRLFVLAALMVALALGWYFRGQSTPQAVARSAATGRSPAAVHAAVGRSIAVLPFVNMSTDAENEFFSDGLSEEILNSLARIDGMQVVGRTSSFQFKGKNTDLRTIGEQLGVAAVLEGSVRREGDRARITAQLIRTSDGIHLWSETYDRTLNDTLAVQLDIAEKVAAALDVLLDDKQRERMRQAGVGNVDAFIAFQKGWKLYGEAHGKPGVDLLEGLRAANVEFDRATVLEPDFFEAHFAKVDLYEHALQRDTLGQRKWLQAQEAALKTLELAAANSRDEQQRLLTLAERQMLSNDWRGLQQRIDAALKAPGCNGSNWLPVFASAFGGADALDQLSTRAIACDPLNAINRSTRVTVALANGKGQRALDRMAEVKQTGGASPVRAIALAMVGRTAEAGRELDAVDPGPRADSYALARIVVGRARGESPATVHAALQRLDRGYLRFDQWLVVDAVEAANAGDRAKANRLAAAMDARPAGPFLLAIMSTSCYCGAPFDLEATPNFKARLAESGLPWPPAQAFPALPGAHAPP